MDNIVAGDRGIRGEALLKGARLRGSRIRARVRGRSYIRADGRVIIRAAATWTTGKRTCQ